MAIRPQFKEDWVKRGGIGSGHGGQFVEKPDVAAPAAPPRAPAAPPPPRPPAAPGPVAPAKAAATKAVKSVKKAAVKTAGPKRKRRTRVPYNPETATPKLQEAATGPYPGGRPVPEPIGEKWAVREEFSGNAATMQRVFNAANAKVELANLAEPGISKAVQAAVAAGGGRLDRFDSRKKTDHSLYRKIQDEMVENKDKVTGEYLSPEDSAAKIRDAVRFSAVISDEDYWGNGNGIGDALEAAGFKRRKRTPGWFQLGYRGRNDTYMSPQGIEFEVQYHTERSLAAANANHSLYDIARDKTGKYDKADKAAAWVEMQRNFDAVPMPSGTPIMDEDKNVIGRSGVEGDPVSAAVDEAHTAVGRVFTDLYGMTYDSHNAEVVARARTIPKEGWDTLPVTILPAGTPLQANESTIKAKHVNKVVSGAVPLREDYDPQLWRDDKGNLHIADGHTRVAMYHGLGRDMPVRIMDEASYRKLKDNPAPKPPPDSPSGPPPATTDATQAVTADATNVAQGRAVNPERDAALAKYMAEDQAAMRTPPPSRARKEPKPDSIAAKTRAATDPARIHANALALMHETPDTVINEGIDWYPDTTNDSIHEWIKGTDVSEMKAEAVTAALSPRVSWAENAVDAENVIQGLPPRTGVMDSNMERALRIMDADGGDEQAILAALRGDSAPNSAYYDNTPKITNFYHNLHGRHDRLTMDTWMGKAGRLSPDERRKLINDDVVARNAKVKNPKPVEKLTLLGPGARPSEHQAGVAERMADEANAAAESAGQPAPHLPSGSLMLEHGYDQMESGYRQAVEAWNTSNPDRALLPDEFQAAQWIWIRGDAR